MICSLRPSVAGLPWAPTPVGIQAFAELAGPVGEHVVEQPGRDTGVDRVGDRLRRRFAEERMSVPPADQRREDRRGQHVGETPALLVAGRIVSGPRTRLPRRPP